VDTGNEPVLAGFDQGCAPVTTGGESRASGRILEIAASGEPPALRLARVLAYTGDLQAARDLLQDAHERLRSIARTWPTDPVR
jgi:hypothetical protein